MPSREKARAVILSGAVLVNDFPATKAGSRVADDAVIRIKGVIDDYVSRGAHKLLPALDEFEVDPAGRTCLDLGASTGGFTDVLLRRGAARVYAVDVGYGQLAWKLRSDERVVVLERTNARRLDSTHVPEPVSLVVCDASFISVTLVVPPAVALCTEDADLLIMIKPQFEVGKGRLGKGGVVRDEALRSATVDDVIARLESHGLRCLGRRDNDIRGPKGNLETFARFVRVSGAADAG